MQILVRTDCDDYADESLLGRVRDAVAFALHRYGFHIIRAEVQLGHTEACGNASLDQRCRIDVRLRGCQPLSVEYPAHSLELAVDGALYRLAREIDGAHESSLGQPAMASKGRQDTSGFGASPDVS